MDGRGDDVRTATNGRGRAGTGPRPARRGPSALPLAYFAFAHLALATACGFVLWSPTAVTGFFRHAWMLGVVHLVTLGWISSSILGALYFVDRIALRTGLRTTKLDVAAFVAWATGVTGMVGHFAIDEMGGMVWSAGLVVAAVAVVGARSVAAMRRSPVSLASRLAIGLAFANLLVAGSYGLLLGLNLVHPFLGGTVLGRLGAHAHLAILGWATLLAVGVAYRLFPMLLPSAMPAGRRPLASVLCLEAGALGLFGGFLAGSPRAVVVAACAALAGIALFLADLAWMRRHPRRRARSLPRRDLAVAQAVSAWGWLAVAAAGGLALELAAPEALRVALTPAYGAALLLGFLGQLVAGVEGRLLPLLAWFRALPEADGEGEVTAPPPPAALTPGWGTALVFALWGAGVPLVVAGLAFAAPVPIGAGALALGVATLYRLGEGARAVVLARRRVPAATPRADRPAAGPAAGATRDAETTPAGDAVLPVRAGNTVSLWFNLQSAPDRASTSTL